jgi:hypothetical protein
MSGFCRLIQQDGLTGISLIIILILSKLVLIKHEKGKFKKLAAGISIFWGVSGKSNLELMF